MKNILKTEEAAQLLLAILVSQPLPYAGWLYAAWFLAPDVGMLGYAVNTRIGAFTYNLLHHKGVAIAVYLTGWWLTSPALQFAGLILFGHSAFDRMLGYGLKYSDNFKHTHLGWLPAKEKTTA